MQRLTKTVWKILFLCNCVRVKKSSDDVNIWCSKKKMWRSGKTTGPHTIGTLFRGSRFGSWVVGVINQTWFCIGNRQLLCSHADLLRELCVIQTIVLVNSGDRCVYCPRRSRFRLPINTTLLKSSHLHSHLHPPVAPLSLSLSNLCHGAAGLPTRRWGVAAPRGRSLD